MDGFYPKVLLLCWRTSSAPQLEMTFLGKTPTVQIYSEKPPESPQMASLGKCFFLHAVGHVYEQVVPNVSKVPRCVFSVSANSGFFCHTCDALFQN